MTRERLPPARRSHNETCTNAAKPTISPAANSTQVKRSGSSPANVREARTWAIDTLHTTADARNRDYRVEVPTDCVASFDSQAHDYALKHMESILGAKLLSPTASGGS